MRVLVTGADGFVGRHLVAALRSAGHLVMETVLHPGPDSGSGVLRLDITDAAACRLVLREVSPTHIVHLAAASSVQWSFEHPEETARINVEGTHNLLFAARALPTPRVLLIGSAEEYGPNDGDPLSELPIRVLHPLSPYAASKVAVEKLVEAEPVFRAMAIRTRSFPHIGPGQQRGFFSSDVASQLVRIERGESEPVLRVGNLDTVRDLADVRDVVRSYVLLLERGVSGEVYNVCSGRGIAIKDVLATLLRLSGMDVRVERDLGKIRPSEIPVLVGDNTKLREATGWSPAIVIEQSLRDILAWWREQGRT